MRIPTKRIRELRRRQTEAEKAAWYVLRGRRLGLKFRRQVPIDDVVVDFYCFERRLAVELDGSIHARASQAKQDSAKDNYLRRLGIRVLRLPNGLVLEDPEGFARKVRDAARGLGGREDF